MQLQMQTILVSYVWRKSCTTITSISRRNGRKVKIVTRTPIKKDHGRCPSGQSPIPKKQQQVLFWKTILNWFINNVWCILETVSLWKFTHCSIELNWIMTSLLRFISYKQSLKKKVQRPKYDRKNFKTWKFSSNIKLMGDLNN